MWWGTIVGLIAGAWLSYSYILPASILEFNLGEITIDNLLHILGAIIATMLAAGIGYLVDIGIGKAD